MANYGNYGNYGGQRRSTGYSYKNNNSGYNNAPPAQQPFDLDAFIAERLDVYDAFVNAIQVRGKSEADYAFALGGWVTSAILEQRRK